MKFSAMAANSLVVILGVQAQDDPGNLTCSEFPGPGTRTTSFVEWDKVAELTGKAPADIETGAIKDRGNDLGLLRLNRIFWPECATRDPLTGNAIGTGSELGGSECGIGLGVDKASHQFVRPILDDVFGTPSGETNGAGELSEDSRYIGHRGEFVSNGHKWTKQDIKAHARNWLDGRDTITSGADVSQWVQQVIHLYGIGITLTAEQADEFLGFQSGVLIWSVLPEDIALAQSTNLGIPTRLEQKEAYVVQYMEALGETMIAQEDWSEAQLRYAAHGILEAFLFAGGLSVPSMIQSAIGAYYKFGLGATGFDPSTYPNSGKLTLEATRYNPPVVGFPYIREDANGKENRDIPVVAMAGFDATKYGIDVDSFNVERFEDVTDWHELSLNWNDYSIHPDRTMAYANRVCPAKDLSYAMVTAFLEELDLKTWTVEALPEEAAGPGWWTEFTISKGDLTGDNDPPGGNGSDTGSDDTGLIVGTTVAGVALLAGLGAFAGYRMMNTKKTSTPGSVPEKVYDDSAQTRHSRLEST